MGIVKVTARWSTRPKPQTGPEVKAYDAVRRNTQNMVEWMDLRTLDEDLEKTITKFRKEYYEPEIGLSKYNSLVRFAEVTVTEGPNVGHDKVCKCSAYKNAHLRDEGKCHSKE